MPKITGKDGALVKSNLKNLSLKRIQNQIEFYLDQKKSENHLSLSAALSADTYNTYMTAWNNRKWQYGDSQEPLSDKPWWSE